MRMAKVGGAWIHYEWRGGDGGGGARSAKAPVLVLAHALGTDLRIWEPLAEALLGAPVRLLLWDIRGHGLSSLPGPGFAIEDHVADLSGLMDRAGVGRAILGGVSIGGMIALAAAARHPERVAGIVTMASLPRFGSPESWDERIRLVEERGLESIADETMARWFAATTRTCRGDEIVGWRSLFTRSPRDGYLANCRALARADIGDDLARIAVLTLLIAGAEDPTCTPAAMSARLASQIERARLETVER
ncbi:MAG: alpha/beta fold hydrolase, partial [Alphaproteobacteria bacterium]